MISLVYLSYPFPATIKVMPCFEVMKKKVVCCKKRQGDRAATGSEGEWHTASLNGMKNNHLRIVNPKHFGT